MYYLIILVIVFYIYILRGNDYISIYFNVNSGKKAQFDVIQCGVRI